MKKFKLFHWVSGMLLLSTLLMSNRCHDPLWDNDSSYKHTREPIFDHLARKSISIKSCRHRLATAKHLRYQARYIRVGGCQRHRILENYASFTVFQ